MKLLKASWFLLALGLLALLLLTGTPWALALLLCTLLLPLAGLLFDLSARKRIRLHWEAPVNLAKGEQKTAALTLENPTAVPVFRLSVRVGVTNKLTGLGESRRLGSFLLPGQKQRIELELSGDYCGRLQLTADELCLSDCFGLIRVRSEAEAAAGVTVQPDTYVQTIRISSDAACPDDSETYSKERPGADLSEPFQIREYREGDSPRQIHWKLSCKLDRMIVREPSLPVTRAVMVFWERTGKSCRSSALTDRQAETVVSACRALADASVQYTVVWNDTETGVCVLQEVRDLDDLIGLLPRLLSARGRETGAYGAEALVKSAGEAVFSHILYIGGEDNAQSAAMLERFGKVTPLLCGGEQEPGRLAELTI